MKPAILASAGATVGVAFLLTSPPVLAFWVAAGLAAWAGLASRRVAE